MCGGPACGPGKIRTFNFAANEVTALYTIACVCFVQADKNAGGNFGALPTELPTATFDSKAGLEPATSRLSVEVTARYNAACMITISQLFPDVTLSAKIFLKS